MSEIKDLYADYRFLNPLVGAAKEKYDYYLSQLKTFSNPIEQDIKGDSLLPWQTWENGLRLLYKEMIFDIFKSKSIEISKNIEIRFAGSLAKVQATPFSDLDIFVLVEKKEDAKKKPVFDALNNLSQRIFADRNQLYRDPISINPARLTGTPDDIFELLLRGEIPIVHPFGQILNYLKL